MRICPKCRLIAADDPVCPECGWSIQGNRSAAPTPISRRADSLRQMAAFTGVLLGAAVVSGFSTTRGNHLLPALATGLLVAGLIADAFLLLIIYRTAAQLQEASRWTVGAVLTFPFGTLVFAWLLARRVRLGGPAGRPPSGTASG